LRAHQAYSREGFNPFGNGCLFGPLVSVPHRHWPALKRGARVLLLDSMLALTHDADALGE
jgi:hypothetical protein